MIETNFPFLWGAQYYRAPTPESPCWEFDLQRMRELGFNSVKYWVQWRWSHRGEDRFVFDDLDRLVELAEVNGLLVILNVIFDVAPVWVLKKYGDAKQVNSLGHAIISGAEAHRQIGGHPGPCYNHSGALEERKKFLSVTIDHFKNCAAVGMWNVWNEPELSFPQRVLDMDKMVCYCCYCRRGFVDWLRRKYEFLSHLNEVWGRCYDNWDEIELPRSAHTISDFIDWREFHLDTITGESKWRLNMVKKKDPSHAAFLHVVPNTMRSWNSVTCADDFDLAESCDVFAATTNGGPVAVPQIISAARGKLCYNLESHINYGCTNMHQKVLEYSHVYEELLPQIGMGIRGFLFWQYRPEVLGYESPAWGLVSLDGTDRPVTKAIRTFKEKLTPHIDDLMECTPKLAEIGIWKSRKNEIFHFCIHGTLDTIAESVEAYINILYWHSYPYRIVSGRMLERNELDGLKLLIMPSCYYLTEQEAANLDVWVRRGGVLLNEFHLGGYNGTRGRHSITLPGCGLAEKWGVQEMDSTSSYHLRLNRKEAIDDFVSEDVNKALKGTGTEGGKYFPIRLTSGNLAYGARYYATLKGKDITWEGSLDSNDPCLVSKRIGKGTVFYCATNMGEGASKGNAGLIDIVCKVARIAQITPPMSVETTTPMTVHVDFFQGSKGAQFMLVINNSAESQRVSIVGNGLWKGVFSEMTWVLDGRTEVDLPVRFVDLFTLARTPASAGKLPTDLTDTPVLCHPTAATNTISTPAKSIK